jgi:hypothetical protein
MRRIALTALGFALLLSGVPLFSQMNATVGSAGILLLPRL